VSFVSITRCSIWFEEFSILSSPSYNLRTRHLELVALATHGFDQNREVQLTTSRNDKLIGRISFFHPQADICLQLAVEARPQLP